MSNRTGALIGLKMLVVLVAPVSIYYQSFEINPNGGTESYWSYTSPILSLGNSSILSDFMRREPYFLAALLFALLACIPAMVFNYKLSKWPYDRSIKKTVIGVLCVSSPFFWQFITSFMFFSTIYMRSWELQYLIYNATNATNWAVFLMILLPLLQREASRLRNQISIYSRSATILVMCALFIPSNIVFLQFGIPGLPEAYRYSISANSSSWTYFQSISGEVVNYSFNAQLLYFQPVMIISIIIQVWFAHSVLQYLNSKSSKRRCLILGITSIVLPSAMDFFFMSQSIYQSSVMIPLPFLFLAGIGVLRYIKPIEQKETVWPEAEVPETTPQVKVPFIYLIRSKLSIPKRQQEPSIWNENKDGITSDDDSKET